MSISGRTRHYADFYSLNAALTRSDDRPFGIVVGNCQAESIRVLLTSTLAIDTIRVPPAFEWTADDIRHVTELLPRLDVLVVQPIRDDYRGLPAGTRQLEAQLARSAVSVRVPALRYAGLHPYQVIARDPVDPSLDPPLVPYHDLRTIVAAAQGLEAPVDHALTEQALRDSEEESLDQLRRREDHHDTIRMSDVLAAHPHWHTINHPDNATLTALAARVCERLGIDSPVGDPGRELLGAVEAPVDPEHARVLDAVLRPDASAGEWRLSGTPPTTLTEAEVARAHLEFYASRPGLVDNALIRHRDRLELLGLRL
ncbi:WcbI family polysaccharide biosynthesis putative acetyltransferase [Brevibacterium sp. CS2]|uniref:WcbI family polysaccharide biosynthesis putative acetyltransferase n=1 Tax=Brevibacterium sp. CS2 TaxID=2575923 RepID=UPI001C2F3219|nr:WcbI family polysaccharide biosynthesis putative acetyltransferase [Brevibacterium sp. CS2]